MKRNTFRYLESITYEYYDILKQIKEIEQEILHATDNSHDDVQPGKVTSKNINSETETRATALLTDKRLIRLKQQVEAIDKVYDSLMDEKRELIKIYYWNRPAGKNLTGLAHDLNLTPRTAYRWRREFIIKLGKELGEI